MVIAKRAKMAAIFSDHVSLASEIGFNCKISISMPRKVCGSSPAETDENCGCLLYKLLNFYCKVKEDRFAEGGDLIMAAEGIPAARLLHGVRGLRVPSPRRENCIHLKANFNRAVSLFLI